MHYLKKNIRTMLAALVLCCIGCDNGLAPQLQDSLPPYTEGSSIISIEIVDSVGGTFIQEQTTLTIYDSSTQEPVWTPIPINGGKVDIPLPRDKCYTFKLSGKPNRLAGSTLENYAVTKTAQNLTLIQRKPQRGAAVEAPSITRITLNEDDLNDNGDFHVFRNSVLKVEFMAPSRAIQPVPTAGNFGCAFAVGVSASAENRVKAVTPKCTRNQNGSWRCTAEFPLTGIEFLTGIDTLTITAYDTAGNRVERHINALQFQENRPGRNIQMQHIFIHDFRVEMLRYPHTIGVYNVQKNALQPFGLLPHDGRATSSETKIWFSVKYLYGGNVSIRAFDIYRRKAGETEWRRVGRKQYEYEYSGFGNIPGYSNYIGMHLGYDTAPIEEGVLYEYKVQVFIDSMRSLETPIAVVSLLPASTIRLESPADNGTIKKSAQDALSFQFRITNTAIWDNRMADFFSFGILLTEKTSDQEVIFAGKATIALKADAGHRLSLQWKDGKSYTLEELKGKGWIPLAAVEDDFITYNNGLITLKPTYFQQEFNHSGRPISLKTGYSYAWDILDWGNDPKNALGHEPARFEALWLSKDQDGRLLTREKFNSSEAPANTLRSSGSLNGRFYFRVTDN